VRSFRNKRYPRDYNACSNITSKVFLKLAMARQVLSYMCTVMRLGVLELKQAEKMKPWSSKVTTIVLVA
jgi:hypothetical protein